MSVHDDLELLAESGRWRELEPFVDAPIDSDVGKEARKWYRSRRAHWTKEVRSIWGRDPELDHRAVLRILAVAFAPADSAARWIHTVGWAWGREGADLEIGRWLHQLAAARGEQWCTLFVQTASEIKLGRNDFHAAWIVRAALPLLSAGLSPLPTGPAYGTAWAMYYAGFGSEIKWEQYRAAHPEHYKNVPRTSNSTPNLADALRTDPALTASVSLMLATPGAMANLESAASPAWAFGSALAELVAEGTLDRGVLLSDTLAALTRQETPRAQKGLAKLLAALGLSGADLASRMPLVQGLLATSRGSVTAVVLPAALEAASAADLVELSLTILSRPEKAQRMALLRALTAKESVQRWGNAAVIEVLSVAAADPDKAYADRAASALARLGAAAPEAVEYDVSDLWAALPASVQADPVKVIEPSERGLAAAVSRERNGPADGALLWDAVVRFGNGHRAAAIDWARQVCASAADGAVLPSAVYGIWNNAAITASEHAHYCTRARHALSPGFLGRNRNMWGEPTREFWGMTASRVVHQVLIKETALRLGEIPFLLSTPSFDDGTLRLDDLLTRLTTYGDMPVGRADLFVALCRVGPTDPSRARDFAAVRAPLFRAGEGLKVLGRRADRAGDLVSTWVAAGGLPLRRVAHLGRSIVVDPVSLPVDPERFGLPDGLTDGFVPERDRDYSEWSIDGETGIGLMPYWPDLLVARTQNHFNGSGRYLPRFLRALAYVPGAGPGVQHAVAATLCHADEDYRLEAALAALWLMGFGRWSSEDYTTCCLHQLDDGRLGLSRISHSWEQLILGGGLAQLWPSVNPVLDRTCSLPSKPSGLADLLAMLRQYVGAVPDVSVPTSLDVLAGSRGSSKAKTEAAAYIAAVERSTR